MAYASFRVRVQGLRKAVRSAGDAESSAGMPRVPGDESRETVVDAWHGWRLRAGAELTGIDAGRDRVRHRPVRLRALGCPFRVCQRLLTRPSADAFPDRVAAVPGLRFSGDEPSSAPKAPPTRLDDGEEANP